MLIELEGYYLKDGAFVANVIDDHSDRLVKNPDLKNEFEARGKVGKLDVGKRTITLMGITIQIADQTQIKR